jgi:hypothetical protein
MAKRVAPRRAHGERSHQVDKDENIIPIDHETSEIIPQQKKLFREKFGRAGFVHRVNDGWIYFRIASSLQ